MSATQRWYTVAYRAYNGDLIPVSAETIAVEHLAEVLAEWQTDDCNEYFIAYRDVPAWTPVSRPPVSEGDTNE